MERRNLASGPDLVPRYPPSKSTRTHHRVALLGATALPAALFLLRKRMEVLTAAEAWIGRLQRGAALHRHVQAKTDVRAERRLDRLILLILLNLIGAPPHQKGEKGDQNAARLWGLLSSDK